MRGTTIVLSSLVACVWTFANGADLAAEITAVATEEGVTIEVDGAPFAKYVTKSGKKPIVWPIIGPTGKEMTRGYPMRDAIESEASDHVHHRSLWFSHGDVNGVSFWDEERRSGSIVHREFLRVSGGAEAIVATRNEWLDDEDDLVCSDVRVLTFGAAEDRRWIDFDITIHATAGEVKFGDTKEGAFGVRVPGTMKVDAKLGGHIVNSVEATDKDTWGKRASWVDYHGPVEGETLGIAIFNHPTSYQFPTYWHVRTYGLFAANPFGLHNFENSNDVDGSCTIQPGDSLSLRYRVLLHKGDADAGRIPEAFVEYAKLDKNALTAAALQETSAASAEAAP